jgi:hypothetical protein
VVLGGARRERRQRAAAGRVVSVSHEGNDCFPGTPEEVVVISIDSAHPAIAWHSRESYNFGPGQNPDNVVGISEPTVIDAHDC